MEPQIRRRIKRSNRMRKRRYSCFSDPRRESSPSDRGLHRRRFPPSTAVCSLSLAGHMLPLRSRSGNAHVLSVLSTNTSAASACAPSFWTLGRAGRLEFQARSRRAESPNLQTIAGRGTAHCLFGNLIELPDCQTGTYVRVAPGQFGCRVVSPGSQTNLRSTIREKRLAAVSFHPAPKRIARCARQAARLAAVSFHPAPKPLRTKPQAGCRFGVLIG